MRPDIKTQEWNYGCCKPTPASWNQHKAPFRTECFYKDYERKYTPWSVWDADNNLVADDLCAEAAYAIVKYRSEGSARDERSLWAERNQLAAKLSSTTNELNRTVVERNKLSEQVSELEEELFALKQGVLL